MQPTDRRKHRRFSLQLEATLILGTARPVSGHLLELSVGGAFITARTDASITENAGAFVHFVHGSDQVCEATGYVVRILPFGAERGLAIEFGYTNSALDELLRTLVATPPALLPELLSDIRDIQIRLPG